MPTPTAQALALLRGTPVRAKSWPSWPIHGPEQQQAPLRPLHCGKWGKRAGGEGAWPYQSVLLGSPADMDDIVLAMHKIYDHGHALAASRAAPAGAAS